MTSKDLVLLSEGIEDGELSTRIMGMYGADDILEDFLKKNMPNKEPYYALSTLEPDIKKELLRMIKPNDSRCVIPPYKSCNFKICKYLQPKCPKRYELKKDKRTKFCVEIETDLDRQIIEDQYFEIETEIPKLDPSFDPLRVPVFGDPRAPPIAIDDYDSSKVLFSYCAKPGIRLLHNYAIDIENHEIYHIPWDQVLHADKELIHENMYALWNELIGHDLGHEVDVTLPDSNATQVHKFKFGFQTKTNDPKPLVLSIPLLFDHNDDELNTGLLKKKSINLVGEFEKSDLIVRADYVDGANEPIRLPVAPLVIKKAAVLNNYTKSSDNVNALKTNVSFCNLVSVMEVDRYKLHDFDKPIQINGHGVVEAFGVIITPKHYEDDFYLWTEYEEIQDRCTNVPVFINNDQGERNFLISKSVRNPLPNSPVESIGLSWNDINIKEVLNPKVYKVHQKYRMAKRTKGYHLREVNGLHMFLINDHTFSRQISCLMNISSIRHAEIELKFKKDYVDSLHNTLNCGDYTMKILRFHINTLTSYGRTMGLNYLQ